MQMIGRASFGLPPSFFFFGTICNTVVCTAAHRVGGTAARLEVTTTQPKAGAKSCTPTSASQVWASIDWCWLHTHVAGHGAVLVHRVLVLV